MLCKLIVSFLLYGRLKYYRPYSFIFVNGHANTKELDERKTGQREPIPIGRHANMTDRAKQNRQLHSLQKNKIFEEGFLA